MIVLDMERGHDHGKCDSEKKKRKKNRYLEALHSAHRVLELPLPSQSNLLHSALALSFVVLIQRLV
jgi:hypothetical protein